MQTNIFAARRPMLCKRRISRHAVSVRVCTVRPFVTFVDSVETNKHIFLVFRTKRHGKYSDGNPGTVASNASWRIKITILTNISLYLRIDAR